MNETNTVTIPLNEYFDLRMKAEANTFLMKELGELGEKLFRLENKVFELEARVNEVRKP